MNTYLPGKQITVKARFGVNLTHLKAKALAGDLTISVYSVTGMTGGDSLILNPGAEQEETRVISSISGLVITLTAALSFDHQIGEQVDELADPTAVTFKWRTPEGGIASYTYAAATVTRDSLGVFSKNLSLTAAHVGKNWWTAIGTGTVETAEEVPFLVGGSVFN